ncbi:MAG: PfkB family carbohydrate kinase, partial [Paracoccaceae bacterium]|nr:PfkB family carbohydrate kinase [Paracoccaceae bacterium]
QLGHYGIGREYVRTVGGEARTSLAVVATRLDDTQTVIYRNGAADFEMTVEDVEGIDYSAFSALIATGTALAMEPSRSATFRAFEMARQAGLTLILDIDYRPYSWASAGEAAEVCGRAAAACDLIVGNDVEFGFLAGSDDAGLEKARELVRQGARAAIYKMGEHGAVTITPDGERRAGIYATKALKPTGAGDAFMGGLVSALGAGLDLQEAVLRGSATAAIVVSRVGCAPAMPTRAELDEFLQTHPGPTGA